MIDQKIADLRKSYTKGGLVEKNLPKDPMELFRQWFDEALSAEVPEPNAMALSTTDEHGRPDGRIVLLKGIENGSALFFTNYGSKKGGDLEANPYAAATFWWAELERQVRLAGSVEKLNEAESREYFNSRPRESRIGAWASSQSSRISGRKELEEQFQKYLLKFEGKEIPKPDFWGGFKIIIEEIEFWQGRPGRLHDRIRFFRQDDSWAQERLAP